MARHRAASPGAATGLKVAIVGGSIAGCAAAIALLRVGCDVTVYEYSTGKLDDRGTGIGMPLALLHTLVERNFVEADMADFQATKSLFVVRADENKEMATVGRQLWEQPIAVALTNWGIVYRHLRCRFSDTIYHQGQEITAVSDTGEDSVSLQLVEGHTEQFDLVVWADGQHSVARRLLFPAQPLQYVGYILWRGLAGEPGVSNIQRFEDRVTWAVSDTGYCLLYLVPSRTEEVAVGKRQVTWVLYENVADKDLPEILTDVHGVVHPTSLPPGAASAAQVAYLHNFARQQFPGYVADAVCATTTPFIQAVLDMRISRYSWGPICLVGDASTICRPHAASGAVKALTNAIALADAFSMHGSIDDALRAWDAEQSAEGNRLGTLGQVMGRTFVQAVPEWKKMDEATMQQWWTALMNGQPWYVTNDALGQR